MPRFSTFSRNQLATCDARLRKVANMAIELADFRVLEGHRSRSRQRHLYDAGLSQIDGDTALSKHNYEPARAFDFAPWPINWHDRERFIYFAGILVGIAASEGIALRWGGDWDRDAELDDNRFDDLGHIELL